MKNVDEGGDQDCDESGDKVGYESCDQSGNNLF